MTDKVFGEAAPDGVGFKIRCQRCDLINVVTVTWEEIRMGSAEFVPAGWEFNPKNNAFDPRVVCAGAACDGPLPLVLKLDELKGFLLEGIEQGYVASRPIGLR